MTAGSVIEHLFSKFGTPIVLAQAASKPLYSLLRRWPFALQQMAIFFRLKNNDLTVSVDFVIILCYS